LWEITGGLTQGQLVLVDGTPLQEAVLESVAAEAKAYRTPWWWASTKGVTGKNEWYSNINYAGKEEREADSGGDTGGEVDEMLHAVRQHTRG
jgi:hypothetical protein